MELLMDKPEGLHKYLVENMQIGKLYTITRAGREDISSTIHEGLFELVAIYPRNLEFKRTTDGRIESYTLMDAQKILKGIPL